MNTDPQRWLALERELDALLALPEDERAARLRDVEQHRPEHAQQLRDWLAAIASSSGFLENSGTPRPCSGLEVGPWRLVRPLGAGGMGEVWLAERSDGAFAKHVAIKFVHHHAPHLHARFAQERQVLARLEHPGIARLIDAGIVDGQPYLVTEFVEGLALDVWCERHAADLRTRLALFGGIANAIAYAHTNLIVHRDLKPANVLVDAHGKPRLLDFGIAKLIDPHTAAQTADSALTPPFAAPEQLTGTPITTRTDVYALGALLYWLLSGRLPLDTSGMPMAALVRRICEDVPPPPSAVAHVRGIDADRLRGDLDAIALKALAKNPYDRYVSVDALLADLENAAHLRPVQARQPTATYCARRYLRRHRVAVSVVIAFALAIVTGIAATAWQAHIAAAERDAALAHARRNGIAYDFMLRLFAAYANAPQQLPVDELVNKAQNDVRESAVQDERRDTALAVLGELQYLRGNYRAAAAILAPLLRARAAGLSRAERFRAQCQLAASLGALGDAQARTWLDAALHDNPDLYSADRAGLLACRIVQSTLLRRADDLAAAVANDRAVLRELQSDPDSDRNLLAEAHANLAFALNLATQYAESIVHLQQAISLYREVGRGDSEDVAAAHASIAIAQMRAGLARDAQASFEQALALHRRANAPSTWRAETLVHAAQLQDTLGHTQQAHALLDEAEAILDSQSQPGSQQHLLLMAERLRALIVAGDSAAARAAKRKLRAELDARFAPDHYQFDLLAFYDASLHMLGEPAPEDAQLAREAVERAIGGMRVHPTSRRLLPAALIEAARVALHQNRTDDARSALREARELLAAVEDPDSWQLAWCDALIAHAQLLGGEADAARTALQGALQKMRAQLGEENWRARQAAAWLGDTQTTASRAALH
jgi:hypothetical protein